METQWTKVDYVGFKKAAYWSLECESSHDLVDRTPHKDNAHHEETWLARDRSSGEWLGVGSYTESMAILEGEALAPWAASVDKLQAEARDSAPSSVSVRRRRRRGPEGGELDVDAVYAGNLDRAWIRTERQSSASPRTRTLWVDVGCNSSVLASQTRWIAVAAAVAADAWTQAGFSVEIIAGTAGRNVYEGKVRDALITVPIKGMREPLDIGRILAWTGPPGLRHAMFWAYLNAPAKAEYGLGQNQELRLSLDDYIGKDPTRIVMPEIRSKGDAQKWLTSLGVEGAAEAA